MEDTRHLHLTLAMTMSTATATATATATSTATSIAPAPATATATEREKGNTIVIPRASLGTTCEHLTAFVVTVNAGEDVTAKILSLVGPVGIYVLWGNGTVSDVTLRRPSSSGGDIFMTYKGRYDMLSLSGHYCPGGRSPTNGLKVTLGDLDNNHVIGGDVAGLMTAASRIQVLIGCILPKAIR